MTLAVEAEGVSMKSEDWFFCRKQTLISGGAVFILYKTIIIILCHQTNIQSQPWAYMFLLLSPWVFPLLYLTDQSIYAIVECDYDGITASRFGRIIWQVSWPDIENIVYGIGAYSTNAFFISYKRNTKTSVVQIEYSKKAKIILSRYCRNKTWATTIESATLFGFNQW